MGETHRTCAQRLECTLSKLLSRCYLYKFALMAPDAPDYHQGNCMKVTTVHRDSEMSNKMKIKDNVHVLDIGSSTQENSQISNPVMKIKSEAAAHSDSEIQNNIEIKEESLVLDVDLQNEESYLLSDTMKIKNSSEVEGMFSEVEIKEQPLWLERIPIEVTSQQNLFVSNLHMYSEIKDEANEDFPATESARLQMEETPSTCSATPHLSSIADLEEENSSKPAEQDIKFSGADTHDIYRSSMMETFSVAKTVHCHNSETSDDNKESDKHNKCINRSNKLYACEMGNKSFSQLNSFNVHGLFHKGKKPYKCNVCNKCFTRSDHLKGHILTHEGKTPFKCNVCDKGFVLRGDLKRHTMIHEGKKPYKCDVCDKCFIQSSNLKTHILTHEGKRPYSCDVCNKSYTKSSTLKSHILTHGGKRPYKCDVCDKCYTQKSHLKSHILTHEGKRPYKCDVCDKCYTKSSNLKTHILTHEGKRPYKCNVCDKCFTQRGSLKTHILIHEAKKPYKCDVCDKGFTKMWDLKRHILIHKDERPQKEIMSTHIQIHQDIKS